MVIAVEKIPEDGANGIDVDLLTKVSINAIDGFYQEHHDETFYAMAIDANMLCLNSEEEFKKTLEQYRSKYPDYYHNANSINELKQNTGDWAYQGFYYLSVDEGFSNDEYRKYRDMDGMDRMDSPYYKAMRRLIENITTSNSFYRLKKTETFEIYII